MVHGVQSRFHQTMQMVTRISAMLEELMRNFHMIFESVFGLIYGINAFREVSLVRKVNLISFERTSTKYSFSFAFVKEMGAHLPTFQKGILRRFANRLGRKLMMLWRVLMFLAAMPFMHSFSPVRFILRIFGLSPPSLEDDFERTSSNNDDRNDNNGNHTSAETNSSTLSAEEYIDREQSSRDTPNL